MKFLLWSIGGFKVYVCGCSHIAKKLQQAYSPEGERAFDFDFFQKLYEKPLEIKGADGKQYAVYYVEDDSEIEVPSNYNYEISGDNKGGYIITVDLSKAE